jgi:two-component sensor histidine kinase
MAEVSWRHDTELAPVAASVATARDFVRLHLREHDLGHLVDDMRLTVSELATNAVEHAGTPFTVLLQGDGVLVLLTLDDSSPGVPVELPPGAASTGGRGLAIVGRLSHDWGVVRTHGTHKSVWASFRTS